MTRGFKLHQIIFASFRLKERERGRNDDDNDETKEKKRSSINFNISRSKWSSVSSSLDQCPRDWVKSKID